MYENITRWGVKALLELAKTQSNLIENALIASLQRDSSLRWALVTTAYSTGMLTLDEAARLLAVSSQNLAVQLRVFGIHAPVEEEDTSAALAQCALG